MLADPVPRREGEGFAELALLPGVKVLQRDRDHRHGLELVIPLGAGVLDLGVEFPGELGLGPDLNLELEDDGPGRLIFQAL